MPLTFHWVGDMLLTEQLEEMAEGDDETPLTPALVFCFNRDECWNVAEQLKGKRVLSDGQQARLVEELEQYDWSQGAGPKLQAAPACAASACIMPGVLPKYRRDRRGAVPAEAAVGGRLHRDACGGHQPAGPSVVLPSIMKGPPDKKKLIDPSTAHQIFGRAGRPQFDKQGYVFVLAHEDDVKIARWREKYDQIPEDTKDPGLLKAKKALKKKMPTRRANEQYWNEAQFQKLHAAPPGKSAQPRPAALAAAGLHARRLARSRSHPPRWSASG